MNQALAAGLNGWTLQNPIAKGASVAYEGVKNVIINGKNVAKTSTALITPNATQVAKLLGKGVAGVALSFAVEQLLGKVDWVLDPANNQIIYHKPNDSDAPPTPADQYMYEGSSSCSSVQSKFFASEQAANNFACQYADCNFDARPPQTSTIEGQYIRCSAGYLMSRSPKVLNPAYDPAAEKPDDKPKHLPLDVVAEKVISNAESGDKDAQVATTAAAADIVAEAETDSTKARPIVNQLEANAKTETDADANTATGETKPNTETGGTDLALEFPTFCGWAPQVCEAAQVVINFPTTLTDWWNTGKTKAESWAQSISQAWTATKEWMNKEDTPEKETTVEIDQTVPVVPNTSYFNWGAYCPFTPGSQTISIENTSAAIDYDLTSWCELAADLRPFVLAAGALMSFLIASGVIMGRDD